MQKTKEKRQPIKVFVRVRPLSDQEKLKGSHTIISCSANYREIVINERGGDKLSRKFTFDRVFAPESKQMDLYKSVASPLIKEVLDGYNCTIFAYGQTGSGKTYTMEGNVFKQSLKWNHDSHAGIIPRAVGHLFDELRLLKVEYSVKASFLEIYNEELFDLLSSDDDSNKLRLFEDAVRKGAVIVNGLDEIIVRNKEEVYSILERGSKKRQIAATLMNAASSRSHTVFSVTVRIKENGVDDDELVRTGKLNLVDLAGSENIGRSGAVEKRAREAGNINQSLLTLGRVITALVEKTPHIPYRESKLTRLLQESLGGRTKTCIIASISPSHFDLEETLSTLDYAHRAKNIQNKPEINQKIGKAALIQEYHEEIQKLKVDLAAARQKNGFYLAEENYNSMITQIDSQKHELSVLLGDMKTVTETLERKEELNRELSESLHRYMEDLSKTQNSLEESEVLLDHHIKTEEKLSSEAQCLLNVAETASHDVNVLQNTLTRKRNLEANNITACKNIATISKNKLVSISDLTKNFQASRLRSNEELLRLVGEEQEIAELRTQQLKESLEVEMDHTNTFIKKAYETSQNMVSKGSDIIASTEFVLKESCHYNTQSVLCFFEEVSKKVDRISEELMQFQDVHQNNIKMIVDKFLEGESNVQRYLESVTKHASTAKQNMEVQEKLLESAAETFSKHIQSMKSLQTMFQQNMDFVEDEQDKIKSSLASMKLSSSNLEDLQMDVNSLSCVSETHRKSMNALCDSNMEVVVPVISELRSVCSNINEGIERQKLRVPELQEESLTTSLAHLNSLSCVVSQSSVDQECNNKELHNHIVKATNSQLEYVHKIKQEIFEVEEKSKQHIDYDSKEVISWNLNAFESISDCIKSIEKFVAEEFTEDSPSGNTPQRREFVYPPALTATSPHERILERFRAAKIEEMENNEDLNDESSSERLTESGSTYESSESLHSSSEDMVQTKISKRVSKSTSNIYGETSKLSLPSKSESSIPNVVNGKENLPQIPIVTDTKVKLSKRQVLAEYN